VGGMSPAAKRSASRLATEASPALADSFGDRLSGLIFLSDGLGAGASKYNEAEQRAALGADGGAA